jgi:hypothetical protein
LAAGKFDSQQYDPIARHVEADVSLVIAGRYFFCFAEHGRHTGMRHVCLYLDGSAGDGLPGCIGDLEGDDGRAYANRLGGDLITDRDLRSC